MAAWRQEREARRELAQAKYRAAQRAKLTAHLRPCVVCGAPSYFVDMRDRTTCTAHMEEFGTRLCPAEKEILKAKRSAYAREVLTPMAALRRAERDALRDAYALEQAKERAVVEEAREMTIADWRARCPTREEWDALPGELRAVAFHTTGHLFTPEDYEEMFAPAKATVSRESQEREAKNRTKKKKSITFSGKEKKIDGRVS
jgi:hypothetical protein